MEYLFLDYITVSEATSRIISMYLYPQSRIYLIAMPLPYVAIRWEEIRAKSNSFPRLPTPLLFSIWTAMLPPQREIEVTVFDRITNCSLEWDVFCQYVNTCWGLCHQESLFIRFKEGAVDIRYDWNWHFKVRIEHRNYCLTHNNILLQIEE